MAATNSPSEFARRPFAVMAGLAARAESIATAIRLPTWAVFLAATGLGGWALSIYSKADVNLAYGDAVAHLNIARGVIDSTTPSFSQLGGVWLPLPHLLMLPTIWNDTMWHTGLSGSLVSVLAFGFATAYLHRIIIALTGNNLGAVLGCALFATNANLLYVQSTPMVEALTIFLVLGATFHLLRWTQSASLIDFLLSAVFVLAATLTRYETWILVPAGIAVVAATSYKRRRSLSDVEGYTLAWGVLACYGIFLWLLYNQVVFGDMLNFSSSPGAATSYAALADANGLLPTKHDPFVSAWVFGWSVVDNLGMPLVLASAAGSVLLLVSRVALPIKMATLLPLSLFAFHVTSLTAGQSVVWSPHSFPNDFYNTRYGLLILPAAVIAASYLAAGQRRTGGGSIGLLVLSAALLPQLIALPGMAGGIADIRDQINATENREVASGWVDSNFPTLQAGHPITLVEALIFSRARDDMPAEWLGEHAQDGKILVSAQANNSASLMFHSGLPLSHFISEGNKPYFDEELQSPGRYTRWIVYQPGEKLDAIRPAVESTGLAGFRLAYESGGFQVFKRDEDSGTSSINPNLDAWSFGPIGWSSP